MYRWNNRVCWFWSGIFSSSIIILRLTHVACINVWFSIAKSDSSLYSYITIGLSLHLFECLGLFHSLHYKERCSEPLHITSWVGICSHSLEWIPKGGWLGHMEGVFNLQSNCFIFPSPFTFMSTTCENSVALFPHQHSLWPILLVWAFLSGCVVLYHCGFHLDLPNENWS